MGLIREPLDVDFTFASTSSLTEKEEQEFSEYIRKRKEEARKKRTVMRKPRKKTVA